MKPSDKELDAIIQNTFAEIRDENPPVADSSNAADRVWKKISNVPAAEMLSSAPEQIRGCPDFQALIPAYLNGTLSQARMMLVEDHTHECVPCRKALKLAKSGPGVAQRIPVGARRKAGQGSHGSFARWRWAVAAALIVAAAAVSLIFGDRFFGPRGGFDAVVYAMSGSTYQVSDSQTIAMKEGEGIKTGQRIRAGKDCDTVLKLKDGSTVEMKARSELFFTEGSGGTTIHLDRGNIIVEAAHQGDHHLYVATGDCMVAVKGTIFSVDAGVKGSQVAVVRGQVQVDYAGEKHLLGAGQQTSTNPELKPVPVKYQVSWSRNQAEYVKLLADLESIKKEVNAAVAAPGLRYSSDLLDIMPAGTVLYIALPNLSQTLEQSNKIIEQHMKQNPALADWYRTQKAQRDDVVDKISTFGQYIGNEIVLSAEMNPQGNPGDPLVVCDLTNAAGFRSAIEQQVASGTAGDMTISIVDDPATATAATAGKTIYVWITGDKTAASTALKPLQDLESAIAAGGSNPFISASFHSDIATAYQQGVSEVIAADLEQIMADLKTQDANSADGQSRIQAYTQLGLFNLKHFILVNKQASDQATMSAALSFTQSDHGIVSWLAQPGPMGALDFVSPDANVAAAFTVKNTGAMVNDLLATIGSFDKSLPQDLDKLKAETGIDIRTDFAAPLGGEYVFAIDGPVLPSPSWKLIVEVYDQGTLQQTMQKFVTALNADAAKAGKPLNFSIQQTVVSGQTYYTLMAGSTEECSYTFFNGYMIAGPNRGILDSAIRGQQSGYTLPHSSQFQSALPADGNTNFSAILYYNVASTAGTIANSIAGNVLSGEQQALKSLASVRPSLAYAYAEGDQILFGATGEGGPFGLSPANLLGIPNAFTLQGIVRKSWQ